MPYQNNAVTLLPSGREVVNKSIVSTQLQFAAALFKPVATNNALISSFSLLHFLLDLLIEEFDLDCCRRLDVNEDKWVGYLVSLPARANSSAFIF